MTRANQSWAPYRQHKDPLGGCGVASECCWDAGQGLINSIRDVRATEENMRSRESCRFLPNDVIQHGSRWGVCMLIGSKSKASGNKKSYTSERVVQYLLLRYWQQVSGEVRRAQNPKVSQEKMEAWGFLSLTNQRWERHILIAKISKMTAPCNKLHPPQIFHKHQHRTSRQFQKSFVAAVVSGPALHKSAVSDFSRTH